MGLTISTNGPAFINLYIQFQRGPCAGQVMTLMCIGVDSLLFHMSEVARVESVYVIGFEVLTSW